MIFTVHSHSHQPDPILKLQRMVAKSIGMTTNDSPRNCSLPCYKQQKVLFCITNLSQKSNLNIVQSTERIFYLSPSTTASCAPGITPTPGQITKRAIHYFVEEINNPLFCFGKCLTLSYIVVTNHGRRARLSPPFTSPRPGNFFLP